MAISASSAEITSPFGLAMTNYPVAWSTKCERLSDLNYCASRGSRRQFSRLALLVLALVEAWAGLWQCRGRSLHRW